MNDEKLTYILLIIASLFLILNGISLSNIIYNYFNVHIFHFNWHYFIIISIRLFLKFFKQLK